MLLSSPAAQALHLRLAHDKAAVSLVEGSQDLNDRGVRGASQDGSSAGKRAKKKKKKKGASTVAVAASDAETDRARQPYPQGAAAGAAHDQFLLGLRLFQSGKAAAEAAAGGWVAAASVSRAVELGGGQIRSKGGRQATRVSSGAVQKRNVTGAQGSGVAPTGGSGQGAMAGERATVAAQEAAVLFWQYVREDDERWGRCAVCTSHAHMYTPSMCVLPSAHV